MRLNAVFGPVQTIGHFLCQRDGPFDFPLLQTRCSVVVLVLEGGQSIALIFAGREMQEGRVARRTLAARLVVQNFAAFPMDGRARRNPVGKQARAFEKRVEGEKTTERMPEKRPPRRVKPYHSVEMRQELRLDEVE